MDEDFAHHVAGDGEAVDNQGVLVLVHRHELDHIFGYQLSDNNTSQCKYNICTKATV